MIPFHALIIFSVTGRDKLADIRALVGNTLPNEWNWVSYWMDATYHGDPIETDMMGVCDLSPYLAELSAMKSQNIVPHHRCKVFCPKMCVNASNHWIAKTMRLRQAQQSLSESHPTNCPLPVVELKTDPSHKALSTRSAGALRI